MNKYKIEIPVLLIGFNRPEIIKQNLENLSQFLIDRLYVAIDGPREHVQGESEKVHQVIDLVNRIDFCNHIEYRISSINKGCEVTETNAISWVLEKEDYVIVLEDDIIAHRSFFEFMKQMLIRYKDDDRIAMVSGCNFTPILYPNNEDYCFCQSGHIWGWGTWKRVWKDYNLFEVIDNDFLSKDFLESHSANKEIAKKRYYGFKAMKDKGMGNNTWDYMFSYFRVTRGLLSIVPKSNLTSNIGIIGLHAKGETKSHNMVINDEFNVMIHPSNVYWLKEYDIYHYEHWQKAKPTVRTIIKQLLITLNLYSYFRRIKRLIIKSK